MFRRGEALSAFFSLVMNFAFAILVFFFLKRHGAPYWARISIAYIIFGIWNLGTYCTMLMKR